MRAMTIGQVAKRSGVGVETVRFYERKGLLDKPPRRESGYRQYSQDVIRRIQFIKRTKDLGFRRGGYGVENPVMYCRSRRSTIWLRPPNTLSCRHPVALSREAWAR